MCLKFKPYHTGDTSNFESPLCFSPLPCWDQQFNQPTNLFFFFCILCVIFFLSATHLHHREKEIQQSCSRSSVNFSGLLKQNPQVHWNKQQLSVSLWWFTCICTIFWWMLFIQAGIKIRHISIKSVLTPQFTAPLSVLQLTCDNPLHADRQREVEAVMIQKS